MCKRSLKICPPGCENQSFVADICSPLESYFSNCCALEMVRALLVVRFIEGIRAPKSRYQPKVGEIIKTRGPNQVPKKGETTDNQVNNSGTKANRRQTTENIAKS